ncbi:MAG TPA: sugar ABC transporter ATP-binding protein [Actinomycetaceae bacterium]|nr:sugar ABC transporter ATP-binding protein [Actinomycetaceae bacterium]
MNVATAVAAPAVAATGVTKRFDGVVALDEAELAVQRGEIHALLGENGAGKSTLIKVMTGVYSPDAGTVAVAGEPARFQDVREARRYGVVALYQELSIVPTISVAENIVLGGATPSRGPLVQWGELYRRAQYQLDRLNQRIPLRKLAGRLSPVQQTMVAIARALTADARVLILDEPTAALTDTEILDLFTVLRALRDEGVAIIYVSHRLEEVFELCDRLTVMRNGRTIATTEVAATTIDQVIRWMVGREQGELYPRRDGHFGEVVLEVGELCGRRIQDISFEVRRGEILGVGGLAGSGRSELLRVLAGAQRHASGAVAVSGREVALNGVGRSLDAGIVLVPEERRSQGVILGAGIHDNIAVSNLNTVSTLGLVSGRKVNSLARQSLRDLHIKARGPRQVVGQLSGGNQQKVVLAKMLARNPDVLLMDEPTRGIDIGTKAEIYRLMRKLARQGTAIVVVSSELPELLGISDRLIVLHEGRIAGEVDAQEANQERVLSYFYGRDV